MPLVYIHPRIEAEYVRRVRLVNEAHKIASKGKP